MKRHTIARNIYLTETRRYSVKVYRQGNATTLGTFDKLTDAFRARNRFELKNPGKTYESLGTSFGEKTKYSG